jgi:cytochrome c-type biogenesis protein CcmH/NrfG
MTNNKTLLISLICLLLQLNGCEYASQTIKKSSAIQSLEQQLEQQPNDPYLIGQLADAYNENYRDTKQEQYRELAIKQYEKYLEYSPEHAGAILALYTLNLQKRHASRTNDIATHQRLEQLYKTYPIVQKSDFASPSLSYAAWLLDDPRRISNLDDVIKLLKQAIKESPQVATSYAFLSRIYDYQNHFRLAISTLRQGVKLSHNNPAIHHELADKLLEHRSAKDCVPTDSTLNEAIKEYKTVIQLSPDNEKAHQGLAEAFLFAGHFKLRLYEARTLYKMQANFENKIYLATALADTGNNRDEAEKLFLELLTEKPSNSETLYELAQFYTKANQWTLADKYWKLYFSQTPKPDFYRRLNHSLVVSKLFSPEKGLKYFSDNVSGISLSPWEKALKDFQLKTLSSALLLEKAENICQKTEAEFYIGFNKWLENDISLAKKHFQNVLELDVPAFYEHMYAKELVKNI